MATLLRLLILEDNPSDAELVLHALRRAGYDPVGPRVETEPDLRSHLQPPPEIILADFNMPELDALRALEIVQECGLDVPFIIVSGTIGEERAVQVMQHGAADYIIKDRLGRLGQAVTNALEKKRMRDERGLAERRLNAQHEATKVLAESANLEAALPRIIEAVCTSLGWVWTAAWLMDAQDRWLKLAHFWHAPSVGMDVFATACRARTVAHGEGLLGRAWAAGQPVWMPDVIEDDRFTRRDGAVQAGLHGALVVPILLGQKVVGAIEFFSQRIEQPDEKIFNGPVEG